MNATDPDDVILLAKARHRDATGRLTTDASAALGLLYDRHAKRLLAYLCTQFPGRGEDLATSAWIKILEPTSRFDGGNFRAWLFRVAFNFGISELRKNKMKSLPEGADAVTKEPSPLDEWVHDEEERIVNHCLEGLLPLEREVVYRWKQREKHHEIAAALGISRSKSEQVQFTAMKKLRDCAEGAT